MSKLVLQASVGERRPLDVDVLLRFRMCSLLAEDEIVRLNFSIFAILQSVLQLWGGGGALMCDELRCILIKGKIFMSDSESSRCCGIESLKGSRWRLSLAGQEVLNERVLQMEIRTDTDIKYVFPVSHCHIIIGCRLVGPIKSSYLIKL